MHSFHRSARARSLSFVAGAAMALALAVPAEARAGHAECDGGHGPFADGLDQTYRIEHQVPVGPGRSLHVTETFSLRSYLRVGPRRAMVMLPGPVSQGNFYNIDVPGYDGGAIMARRGFFAYAVDFEGTGGSTYPTQGTAVTLESQVAAVKKVVLYVQLGRGVPRVNLLGESWGGGVAAEVCKDKLSARSCVLASMIYKTPSAAAAEAFQSPGWLAFLQAQPNGYLQTVPPFYDQLVVSSPPAVQQWTAAKAPGLYTTEPLFDFFTLPFFDPGAARVPGLILQGEDDPQSIPSDIAELAADYGQGGAVALVNVPGGGHIPRIETAPHNTEFWDAVTGFVDRCD